MLQWACERFHEVIPVYVRCGMKWEKAELFWLKRFLARVKFKSLRPLQLLSVPVRDLHPSHWSMCRDKRVPGRASQDAAVFLPGRNLLLLSKVSVFCFLRGMGNVAVGTLKGNPFSDASPAFFRAMEKVLCAGMGKKLKIYAPFRAKSKGQVVRFGRGLPLDLTFSCLNPCGHRPCENCNKCAERAAVLAKLSYNSR